MENEILKIVGRRKMTISEIAERFYGTDCPFEPGNVVASAVRRINKKCERHELPWTLEGEGGGRHGRTVWRQNRGRK